jgi:hypothetical protein
MSLKEIQTTTWWTKKGKSCCDLRAKDLPFLVPSVTTYVTRHTALRRIGGFMGKGESLLLYLVLSLLHTYHLRRRY